MLNPELSNLMANALNMSLQLAEPEKFQAIVNKQKTTPYEIGGKITSQDGDIDLELIQSSITARVQRIVNILESKKPRFKTKEGKRELQFLSTHVQGLASYHAQYLEPNNADLLYIKMIPNLLIPYIAGKPHLLPPKHKKLLPKLIKMFVLESSYSVPFADLDMNDPSFLGKFHTHPNGTEPSPGDLQLNEETNIPEVVVSFGQQNLDIYLVHNANFELVRSFGITEFTS